MAIVKEFFCKGHGSFESDKPVCPRGCTVEPVREFLTAPSFHNGTTRRTDELVRSQVDAFGLSNIRSSREGETARIQSPQSTQMAKFNEAIRKKYPSPWGTIPDTKQGGAIAALQAHKAEPTGGIDKSALAQEKRPTQYIRDPEGLKVDVSKAA